MLDDLFTVLGAEIHDNKIKKGWRVTTMEDWENPSEILAILMLITTEVAEAVEAIRKNDVGNFKEELAAITIRLIGMSHGMGIDLGDEITKKMEKNRSREYKHGGKRC